MSEAAHWSKMQERGNYLGMQTLLWSYRLFGRAGLWVVMFPVVLYIYCNGKVARKASVEFLNRVNRANQDGKIAGFWDGFKHFCTFANSAFDKIDAWLGRISDDNIEYVNYSLFEQLIERKQGAVFIGSHLGNLDVCRALSQGRYETVINVLVFTHHAVEFNKMLRKINPNASINLIQVTDMGPGLAILLKEKVDSGEIVVIVGDRTSASASGRSVNCEFLGQTASFAQGPFILAAVLECPVYMLFCLKDQGKYKIIFELLSHKLSLPRKERQQKLQQIIDLYASRLAHYAALYPYQWFNFFNFWHRDDQISRD